MFERLRKLCAVSLQVVNVTMMLIAIAVITITIHGYDMVYLDGISMEPAIRSGDLAITSPDRSDLKVGDIVNFTTVKDGEEIQVFHRIIEIRDDGYVTKGDNNDAPDKGVRDINDIKGYSVLTIPHAGFLSVFQPESLWVILVLVAGLNVLAVIWLCLDERELKREETHVMDETERSLVNELENINATVIIGKGDVLF